MLQVEVNSQKLKLSSPSNSDKKETREEGEGGDKRRNGGEQKQKKELERLLKNAIHIN